MGLIFVLSAQPDLPHPSIGWLDWLLSSAAHLLLFAVLAILWARALGRNRRSWLVALALTFLYALSDELHQSFVPGRHADPLDLASDALGAVLGLGGWAWLKRRISISPKGRS
ncbi:MAG: VanZ family protein [Anaerolineae bacterium]|nr:VanZ family protein [Anaerolineae bacterium]